MIVPYVFVAVVTIRLLGEVSLGQRKAYCVKVMRTGIHRQRHSRHKDKRSGRSVVTDMDSLRVYFSPDFSNIRKS